MKPSAFTAPNKLKRCLAQSLLHVTTLTVKAAKIRSSTQWEMTKCAFQLLKTSELKKHIIPESNFADRDDVTKLSSNPSHVPRWRKFKEKQWCSVNEYYSSKEK